MVQLVNRLWNNIFVNPPLLHVHLLFEISGAPHLAQLSLTAGGRWQADEMH